MRILADTHVLLWWLGDDPRLPDRHRTSLSDGATEVLYSAVSIAEIAIKTSLGKLVAPADLVRALDDEGFTPLPLRPAHAAALRDLPWHHRDPFDRMLVAQAMVEDVALASVDARVAAYDVRIV
ncbi:type II toxin-antitoxin system VapC family toxin [Cellulomonas sp. SLBN-39]|uniref:type II toxin-antitoxin system VapC family toxin n=1 Tax=Cellulomonas sp. SLBN-39 TaxID=2768446 RepID=UPI0011549116|nr:type II toxin-antitoxin system VapC family toxin [Cellulomonas sp. SLBN-39]TQL02026.1 PIN domain nuclease of toxin-antitoxin system [Cellulomonas sp. SLBN-39]